MFMKKFPLLTPLDEYILKMQTIPQTISLSWLLPEEWHNNLSKKLNVPNTHANTY